ncbi:hypothetical protein KP509_02G057000 [Ceratopteris richardii]|uniref:Stress-response A/B barrel domain-containing protein n=1 Tax=Ceratopteris richardii TaxID=49495 RepID=A0A8T2V9R7_CERRI|nr:hypothetical protein KP509_02G057000 [Ceratopteris richardii]
MASSAQQQVVEHVVLFRAREGVDRAAIDAWVKEAIALAGLDGVLHLIVGTVHSCKPDDGAWSCALYGRYRDKAALHAYAVHPQHLQLVSLGSTIFGDVMALDWEAHVSEDSLFPSSISNLSVLFFKPTPECSVDDVVSLPHGDKFFTSGPNFSPGRARGFEWGFISHGDVLQEETLFAHSLSSKLLAEQYLLAEINVLESSL